MKKLRIMHGFSEVAGQGFYSVLGLKKMNEMAEMVVWLPNRFAYPYDKTLNIDKNKRIFMPVYVMKLVCFFVLSLFRYNTFHFHYGRSFFLNHELSILKLCNKKIFYEFHGSDIRNNEIAHKRNKYFPANEVNQSRMIKRNETICQKADGIILHDYELFAYLPEEGEKVHFVPLRIDTGAFTPVYPDPAVDKITIVHAPSNPKIKGTPYVIEAINELKKKYPIDFILVQNKTQDEARKIYEKADIIIDQLIIGTYGVFALEGMALGKPVITYIMNDMLKTFPDELPIQNANIDNIKSVIENLIIHPELRKQIGMASRKYVEDYHDYRKIAAYLMKIYQGIQEPVSSKEAFQIVKDIFENR